MAKFREGQTEGDTPAELSVSIARRNNFPAQLALPIPASKAHNLQARSVTVLEEAASVRIGFPL